MICYSAPNYSSPDYVAMLLFQYLLGASDDSSQFVLATGGIAKAIETFGLKAYLLDDGGAWKFAYIPYIKNGVFSGYHTSKSDNIKETNLLLKSILEDFSEILSDDEVIAARNNLLSDMMMQESSQEVSQDMANQFIYIGRRVLRTEWAERTSQYAGADSLRVVARRYFQSKVIIFWL